MVLLKNLYVKINEELLIPPHEQVLGEYRKIINKNYFL